MKRIATAIVVLLVLAAIGLFAPVVPDEMPDGMWEEQVFMATKLKIEVAAEKLNAFTEQARRDGYELPKTFNIVCDYGFRNGRHAVFGSLTVGEGDTAQYAFGTWAIGVLPFLEYPEKGRHAKLRQEHCEEFLAWIDAVDSYPGELLKQYSPNKAIEATR
jgi:hypothetical protein